MHIINPMRKVVIISEFVGAENNSCIIESLGLGGMNMTTTISKKSILVSVVICALLSLLLVGSAYAAFTSVDISKGSGPVFSSIIATNYGVSYYGKNYASSGHTLYISIEEKTGAFWRTDTTNPMGIGQSASGNSKLKVPAQWRVKLNPAYGYTDCNGYGQASGS